MSLKLYAVASIAIAIGVAVSSCTSDGRWSYQRPIWTGGLSQPPVPPTVETPAIEESIADNGDVPRAQEESPTEDSGLPPFEEFD